MDVSWKKEGGGGDGGGGGGGGSDTKLYDLMMSSPHSFLFSILLYNHLPSLPLYSPMHDMYCSAIIIIQYTT